MKTATALRCEERRPGCESFGGLSRTQCGHVICDPCVEAIVGRDWFTCPWCPYDYGKDLRDEAAIAARPHLVYVADSDDSCCLFCGPGPHLPGCDQDRRELPKDVLAGVALVLVLVAVVSLVCLFAD